MRTRRPRPLVILTSLLMVLGIVSGCTSEQTPPEQVAAQKFLDALGKPDAKAAAALTTDVTGAQTDLQTSLEGLGDGAVGTLKVTGLDEVKDRSAVASYSASWKLPGVDKAWTFTGSIDLVKKSEAWLVEWSPAAVHPKLQDGQHTEVIRAQPARGALLDSDGKAIFAETDVVVVGLQPSKVENLDAVAKTLADTLSISAADIVASVEGAKPDSFVTVITLRADYYASVKSLIYDLPGTVFRAEKQVLPPASGWGQPWLGSVGPATKEIIDESKGRIQVGDSTGLSGLQRAYDEQLSGSPGVTVVAVGDDVAANNDESTGTTLATLLEPKPGTDVTLTIDRSAQTAAESALDTVTQAASIVAVQPSTGKILAVANSASTPGNIAMSGQYPAGSDFKIVTYAAAFGADPALTPATSAACPGTINIDGREFENQDKFDQGTVSVADAFAYSCNTTAIEQAMKLPTDALPEAAATLGLGGTWDLPIDAFAGSLPDPTSKTEQAANAIGQGSVLVSPLAMAVVTGAAATGTPVTPSLLADAPGKKGTAIDKTVTANLNTLMQGVVQQPFGTAHALAGLPGGVQGKTGTAEFGTDTPPKSHAWMVGTRGDLAFAVFVYGGESSSTTAVPITSTFLTAYPPS